MEKKIKVLIVVFNLSVANGVSSYVMNYFRNLDHNKIIIVYPRALCRGIRRKVFSGLGMYTEKVKIYQS